MNRPASMSRHAAQTPHGCAVMPPLPSGPVQLSDLARMRAIVVLPTPRVPVKRYAWCSRCCASALASAWTTCAWPTSDSKLRGLYLRASTVDDMRTILRGGLAGAALRDNRPNVAASPPPPSGPLSYGTSGVDYGRIDPLKIAAQRAALAT